MYCTYTYIFWFFFFSDSSFKVMPMEQRHFEAVQQLASSLNASEEVITDVQYYLQAGRDPLNLVKSTSVYNMLV